MKKLSEHKTALFCSKLHFLTPYGSPLYVCLSSLNNAQKTYDTKDLWDDKYFVKNSIYNMTCVPKTSVQSHLQCMFVLIDVRKDDPSIIFEPIIRYHGIRILS